MKEIKTYIFPHTCPDSQPLADDDMVQVQVEISSRLMFKDAYFHELQDGDLYIVPEKASLDMTESDTDILDYILDHSITWNKMPSWKGSQYLCLFFFSKSEVIKQVHYDVSLIDDDCLARGVFREAISELIQENEL